MGASVYGGGRRRAAIGAWLCVVLAGVWTVLAGAAGAQPPAEVQPVAIHAGRLIDVQEGRVLRDQMIVVEGAVIHSVGPAATALVPAGAARIDLRDATVLPGLIDAHVHLSGDPTASYYDLYAVTHAREAVIAAMNARKLLLAGFTTVRNLGAQAFVDVAVRDGVTRGDVPGPRILAAGPPLSNTGGDCDDNHLALHYEARTEGVADGPDALRAMVRRAIKHGVDVLKVCAGGGLPDGPGAPQFTQAELDAIVDEAHASGRKVAIHAHGQEPILRALRAGADTIEHATFATDEAIRLAKAKGAAFAIDPYKLEFLADQARAAGADQAVLAALARDLEAQHSVLRRARAAGVRLIYATDAGAFPVERAARQFASLRRAGATPMETLRMATIEAAAALGLPTVGALAPGFEADLVATRGDPLAEADALLRPLLVMKAGRVYRGAPETCTAASAAFACEPPVQ